MNEQYEIMDFFTLTSFAGSVNPFKVHFALT